VEKKFASRTCADERDLLSDLEHAVNNKNLYHLLEVFAEGVNLSASLPSSVSSVLYRVGEWTILHNYTLWVGMGSAVEALHNEVAGSGLDAW